MEQRLRELEIANAALTRSVEHLAISVKTLTDTVQDLRDTINKGRGAVWLFMLAAGGVGAAVTTLLRKFPG
jgi:hypothetical protein